MSIAVILPRNMHFGPSRATSIDLVTRDAILNSQYRDETVVICQEADGFFAGFEIRSYAPGSTRARLREIAKLLDEIKPRLIIVHQHLPSATGIARRFRRTPVLLQKHNFIPRVSGLRRLRRTWQLNSLAGVIFVSETCRSAFAADFPNARIPSFVAHNGLPLSDWPQGAKKTQSVVAIGRIDHGKGFLEIAEALKVVLAEFPGWRARLIGPLSDDTDLQSAFHNLIDGQDRLLWEGPRPFSDVVAATRGAEIAVVNSRQEAFGRVAIEAFAGECALITTTVGGLAEVVDDAALTLKEGTAEEIAASLRRLISDETLRREMAQRGRARFEANFTSEIVGAQLDEVLRRFL